MTPVIPVWLWVHVALALPSNSESFCSLSSLPKDPGWAWSVNVAIWRASLVPAHWSPQWPSVAWCIAEKPKEPISKLANIGLYYIREVDALWQGIDHVLNSPQNKGEWYLTDAFQWMIEHGRRIRTAEVGGWYDCGALSTVLETNGIVLNRTAGAGAQGHGGTEEGHRGAGAQEGDEAPILPWRHHPRTGAARGRRGDRAVHHWPQRDDRGGHRCAGEHGEGRHRREAVPDRAVPLGQRAARRSESGGSRRARGSRCRVR